MTKNELKTYEEYVGSRKENRFVVEALKEKLKKGKVCISKKELTHMLEFLLEQSNKNSSCGGKHGSSSLTTKNLQMLSDHQKEDGF